jgi:hypothetical protein
MASSQPKHDDALSRMFLHTTMCQVTTFFGLTCHIVLVAELGLAAFPWWIGFIVLLFVQLPLTGYTVFLQVLLYQNWFISVLSPWVATDKFQMLQGTSFAAVALLALVSVIRLASTSAADRQVRSILTWVLVSLVIIAAYTVLGALASTPASAIVYFRNTSVALFALLIGLDIGRTYGYRTVAASMMISVLFGMVLALIEISNPLAFYDFIHAPTFMALKFPDEMFYSSMDVLEYQTRPLFNMALSGDVQSLRFSGPNMHPISYGYVLAVAGLVALSLGHYWFIVPAIGLIAIAGVKGPLILLLGGTALYLIWSKTRSRWLTVTGFVIFSSSYIGIGIVHGLSHGDYHVVGLLGGVQGFLSNPLGHGIGVGGNLSSAKGAHFDWQEFQNWGASFGLESAIGVLLYQMGIGGTVVMWTYMKVLRTGWWRQGVQPKRARYDDILFAAIAVVIVNGVFQEEAYSPYALGLIATLCGVITAQCARESRVDLRQNKVVQAKDILSAEPTSWYRRCWRRDRPMPPESWNASWRPRA